jgi:hypothetical protein
MTDGPYFLHPQETAPVPGIEKPAGWQTLGEVGASLVPPVTAAVVGAAVRELYQDQRDRAAGLGAEAQAAATEPEITVVARDPETMGTRSYVNPHYLGAITSKVAEISQRK